MFGPKQCLPSKPTNYGIKAITLAESEQRYILNILPYMGGGTLDHASDRYATLPQPARVVPHLSNSFLDKGHHLFMDRYYTSVPLATALANRQIAFTALAVVPLKEKKPLVMLTSEGSAALTLVQS